MTTSRRGYSRRFNCASAACAAAASSIAALVTTTAKSRLSASTQICRLSPVIFSPPSHPRTPPWSVVFTVWLSIDAALGVPSPL
jgi:hypothetical protein